MTKQNILQELGKELEVWINIATVDEKHETKDILTHLHAWQLVTITRLEAAVNNFEPVMPEWLQGNNPEPESQEELDAINKLNYNHFHTYEWDEAYSKWKETFEKILKTAEQIPEEYFNDQNRYGWLHGYALRAVLEGTLEHHKEHREKFM